MLKVILMIALIKLLLASDQPFLCSGIYGVGVFLLNLVFGVAFLSSLIVAAVSFGLASLYFWLLSRYEGTGLLWWGILLVGLVLAVF